MEPPPWQAVVSGEQMVESHVHCNTTALPIPPISRDVLPATCPKHGNGCEFTHGISGHSNHHCRCDLCRTGKRDYMRARRSDPVKLAEEREKTNRRNRLKRAADRAAQLGGDHE
jgi:hypothetical protein